MDSRVFGNDSVDKRNWFSVSLYGRDASDQARCDFTGRSGDYDCDPLPLHRTWRKTYVIAACAALYFNVFVLVVQSFEKVPTLKAIAPRQKEPFAIAQISVLVAFVVLTTLAVKKFHPELTTALQARAKTV